MRGVLQPVLNARRPAALAPSAAMTRQRVLSVFSNRHMVYCPIGQNRVNSAWWSRAGHSVCAHGANECLPGPGPAPT